MSVGTHGSVQVDSSYKTYALVQEGSAFAYQVNSPNTLSPPAGFAFSDCLIFIRIPTDGDSLTLYSLSANSATIRGYRNNYATAVPYDYRIYAPVEAEETSGDFGMVIYGEAGEEVFDSRRKTLSFDFFQTVNMGMSFTPMSLSEQGEPAWACISPTNIIVGYSKEGSTQYAAYQPGFKREGGVLKLVAHRRELFGGQPPPHPGTVMVNVLAGHR